MPYLLDTNTLIQAKNEYYAFSICPGFWDWIDTRTMTGDVFSIEPVLKEIRDVADELTKWANDRASLLFRSLDPATMAKIPEVMTWVQQGDFKDEAKRDFLAKADPLLIAYALAHPNTILATHEVHIEGEKKKVKIPTVCRAFGISCVRTFGMLSRENARFVLPS
jgi:hypothetical protein